MGERLPADVGQVQLRAERTGNAVDQVPLPHRDTVPGEFLQEWRVSASVAMNTISGRVLCPNLAPSDFSMQLSGQLVLHN